MTITVRIAAPLDLAEVEALYHRSYPVLLKPDYPPSVLATAIPRIVRAQPALLASGRFYVAEDADGVIGAGGWSERGPGANAPGRGHIRHLATDPRAVRRGVGRRLIDVCLSEARAAGLIELEALATRTAVPFYAAMGFRALGEIDVALGPGIVLPSQVMRRRL